MTQFEPFRPVAVPASPEELADAVNRLGRNMDSSHACMDAFREESRAHQETLLRALRLMPDEAPHKHSLVTMSRASAVWRIGGVVFAGVLAAPLISKLAAAVLTAAASVLLK
jgi:hypothetical protein